MAAQKKGVMNHQASLKAKKEIHERVAAAA
jgi:hypothetical protein